jgi:hypothetical protein
MAACKAIDETKTELLKGKREETHDQRITRACCIIDTGCFDLCFHTSECM